MKKEKQKKPKFSIHISEFCNMIADIKSDYKWNKDEVNRLDKLTQDYLHRLELEGLNYNERAKVATQLTHCRQLRRKSKNTVEVLEPFINFLEQDKGKNMVNLLNEALGKTRKIEERMENRSYRYKVLK